MFFLLSVLILIFQHEICMNNYYSFNLKYEPSDHIGVCEWVGCMGECRGKKSAIYFLLRLITAHAPWNGWLACAGLHDWSPISEPAHLVGGLSL